jgi:hypothetical protein
MADEYLTSYALRNGTVSPEEREQYIQRIGELWNRNDARLKLYFGTNTVRPDIKDGAVRAKQAIDNIDAKQKDDRTKKAAQDLHEQLQHSDSYYKNLTP